MELNISSPKMAFNGKFTINTPYWGRVSIYYILINLRFT